MKPLIIVQSPITKKYYATRAYKVIDAEKGIYEITGKKEDITYQVNQIAQRELEATVERMGWPEIRAFNEELRKGQSIFEDAGGYMLRAIRRLFGLSEQTEEVVTYQRAARAALAAQPTGGGK